MKIRNNLLDDRFTLHR